MEGGHIGIREDSIVYDDDSLNKIISRIFDTYNQPALVEKYIIGKGMREFSVGIIDSEIKLFTPIEIDFESMHAVGACDYSRVDLRMNHTGCYVIEINIMPGLGPHSFLPEAAKDIYALEYDQLVQKLAKDSMQRQKNGS